MEEKIVEIGEYIVRMRLKETSLEVIVLDALGEEIEGMLIEDDEDSFDDEEYFDSEEGEGDDEDIDFDDDDYE